MSGDRLIAVSGDVFAGLARSVEGVLWPAIPLCLAVWLATQLFMPASSAGPERLTVYESIGCGAMLAVLLGRWREVLRSRAFWHGAALIAWFAWRTPVQEWGRMYGLALAVGAGLAVQRLPADVAGRLPNFILWAGMAMLALSFADGLSGQQMALMERWRPVSVYWGSNLRWAGLLYHPNLLAFFIVFWAWAGFSASWPKGAAGWALALVSGGAAGWCMVETFSRAGAALLALACGAGAWRTWRARGLDGPRVARWVLVGGVAAGFVLRSALEWDEFVFRFRATPYDLRTSRPAPKPTGQAGAAKGLKSASSTSGSKAENARAAPPLTPGAKEPSPAFVGSVPISRGDLVRDSVRIWRQRPLAGWGLGAYEHKGRLPTPHSHNLLLEAAISGGAIGAALVLIPLFFALTRGKGFFARGFIALSLLSGLVDCYFFFLWPAIMLATCVGLASRND